MKITEHRTKEILNWLDDKAADHALMFEEMAMFRDAAALVRQLQAEVQDAWQAGLDEGRAQGAAKQPPLALACDYTPGHLDRTAPPRIWLQIDTAADNNDRAEPWPGTLGVTWQDESVGGLEIQYVRADLQGASHDRLLTQQPAAAGEEILVNAAHDVYTLPLQPSGLSSGPRFVVHVPGPEQQPTAVDEAMVFRLAVWMAKHEGHDDPHRLILEGTPPVPWGEVWNRYEYDARAALTAALAAQQRVCSDD